MNTTIFHLQARNILSLSPFLSPVQLSVNQRVRLGHSYFSKFVSQFIKSSFPTNAHISSSTFANFLNGAIRVDTEEFFNSRIFEKHQELVKTELKCERVIFQHCQADTGGAIKIDSTPIDLKDTIFRYNHARVGGGLHCLRALTINLSRVLVLLNDADYDGGIAADSMNEQNSTSIDNVNVTFNSAIRWTGGMRIDHGGGKLSNSVFSHNSALVCGGFFDFTWKPVHRDISICLFQNNSAKGRGGAYSAFHTLQSDSFDRCIFIQNRCESQANSISIESINEDIIVSYCFFDGEKEKEVSMRFGDSNLVFHECNFQVPVQELISLASSHIIVAEPAQP